MRLGAQRVRRAEASPRPSGAAVTFSLRPEALRRSPRATPRPTGCATIAGELTRLEFLGALTRIEARLGNGMLLRAAFLDMPLDRMAAGDAIVFAYDPERITVFGSSAA